MDVLGRLVHEELPDGRPDGWKEILDGMGMQLYRNSLAKKMNQRFLASWAREQSDDKDDYIYPDEGAGKHECTFLSDMYHSGGGEHNDTEDMHYLSNLLRYMLMVSDSMGFIWSPPTRFEHHPRGKFLAELCDGPIPPATRPPRRRRGKSAPPPAVAFLGVENDLAICPD